jgi:phosphatidylinositol alpha-1,6-mannosyltransferase
MEGFGIVALEAAANGIPTVAFAEGGVIDAVKNDESGFLVSPGNYREFADTVTDLLSQSCTILPHKAQKFAAEFTWTRFGEKVRQLLL